MKLKRERYLSIIRPYYESDIIKVITGVRRAGKSILLESIKEELLENGVKEENIIYINFEEIDYDYIKDAQDLNKEIKSRIKNKEKYYIFLDEIQKIENFEKALASFRATLNVSLFVTGSNSTLLSGELATLLTGRIVEFEILPFSFKEMKEYYISNNKEWNDDYFYNYLKWGGFPLRFDYNNEESISKYLNSLYEGIINKDILKNLKSSDRKKFKDIALYILANAGKELSIENIANYYESNVETISKRTIYNYIEKMKKTYLIHGIGKYDLIGKRALKNKEKLYATDVGLRTINTNTINYEDTFFLENIVYNELVSREFKVLTGKLNNGKIDFVAIKGSKKCFIQVAYLLTNESTIKREFNAFLKIKDGSPKYVISLDKIDLSHDGITHLNMIDFLLNENILNLS